MSDSAEPVVPVINPAVLKAKPKPGGACPTRTTLLLLLAVPLLGIVLGVISHFVGVVVGGVGAFIAILPGFLSRICGFIICVWSIFSIIWAILIVLCVYAGYPALVGWGISQGVYWIGKKGRCRSPNVAGLAALLTGIFAYAGHLATAFLRTGNLHIMTLSIVSLENTFDIAITGTPWWMYILIVIEFAIQVIMSFSLASTSIETEMYCEAHGIWYAPWKEATYQIELVPSIAETLESGTVRGLEKVDFIEPVVFPNLKIRFRRCPSSTACELQFKAEVNWQETTLNKKDEKSTTNKTRIWVDTMLPPTLGFAMVQALRLDESKRPNIKKSSI